MRAMYAVRTKHNVVNKMIFLLPLNLDTQCNWNWMWLDSWVYWFAITDPETIISSVLWNGKQCKWFEQQQFFVKLIHYWAVCHCCTTTLLNINSLVYNHFEPFHQILQSAYNTHNALIKFNSIQIVHWLRVIPV